MSFTVGDCANWSLLEQAGGSLGRAEGVRDE
jgi:hypothetical protein